MKRNREKRLVWITALMGVFLVFASPPRGWGQKREAITLKDSWVNTPKVAAFFIGKEKGFFAAEGIDLTMEEGRGSAGNFQLLGAKKILFAIGDAATGTKFISQGLPVKAVWGMYQTSPQAVVVHRRLGVRTPKDLEGKRVGDAPGGAGKSIFTAVAERNGVALSRVQWVNLTPSAKMTALLSGDVDAITTYFPDVPLIRSKGGDVDYFLFADFNVNTLGEAINVHTSVLVEKADALRRLLRGTRRSIEYTMGHRDEAVAALKRAVPLAIKDTNVGRKTLDAYLTLLHTKNTKEKPLGWMAKEDWEETIRILAKYGGLKNPLPVERYYTNDFVPSGG
ncbi:MAG: ABC transporter substrate-binding protein [Candidatus Tectomicrobia bacterium]|nr:ABC transporter substrate-binding protein [Candidatus Tectomicrobia bacterium]